jgi:hypothetical protein
MNKPINRVSRVISSQEEAEIEREAKKLQAKGMAAFGDPNQKFDLAAELNEIPMPPPPIQGMPKTQVAKQEVKQNIKGVNKVTTKPKEEEVKEEIKEEQGEQAEQLSDDPVEKMKQISKIFSKINPAFPSAEQLLNWKAMCGNLFIVEAGELIFIYRYLKRQEWIQMNQDPSFNKQRVDQREDVIFNKCILWPRLQPDQIAALPAGCVTSIVAQVEQQSLFIDPRELANMTIKL